MATNRKRPASRNQLANMDEASRYGVLDICHDELKAMLKAGDFHGDPAKWHPAKVIVRLIETTENETLKFWCSKELLQYVAAPRAAQLRIDANGPSGDMNITIVVPPWAANQRAALTNDQNSIDVTPSHTGVSHVTQTRVPVSHNPSHNDDESVD